MEAENEVALPQVGISIIGTETPQTIEEREKVENDERSAVLKTVSESDNEHQNTLKIEREAMNDIANTKRPNIEIRKVGIMRTGYTEILSQIQ